MKKLISIASMILAFVVLWQGCTKPEETGTIYGIVTDYDTGEPLEHAVVELFPGGETMLTGVDGYYLFKDLKPSQYSLSCLKSGYDSDRAFIELTAGKDIRYDVLMKKQR